VVDSIVSGELQLPTGGQAKQMHAKPDKPRPKGGRPRKQPKPEQTAATAE
jgi:hypothetical protein